MKTYPLLDIRFPGNKEASLLDAMRQLANEPWQWQPHNAFGKPPEDGHFYFHRAEHGMDPPCTLCIRRENPGHFVVGAIVPDANTVHSIPVEQYVGLLREFDGQIAAPAAEGLDGLTSIGTSEHRLEDYFSPGAVKLLERFCQSSNAGDLGTHPSDQEKWIAFLLHVYRNKEDVHCDIFGACLKTKRWWPDHGIDRLVHEYDFAMSVLRQAYR